MKNQTLQSAVFLVLIFAAGTGASWLVVNGLYFSALLIAALAILLFWIMSSRIQRVLKNAEQVVTALHRDDYSVKIPENRFPPALYQSLRKLYDKQKTHSAESYSQRFIFESIIERMATGILILRKDADKPIEVFFSNAAFSGLLEIPKFTRWHLLSPYLKSFPDIQNSEAWQEKREVLTLSVNRKEQIFSFRTYLTKVYDSQYLIVHLDTLQSIIDKKEKEAYFNLMKVMSHEILNTITPINALAQNLDYLIEDKKADLGEDFADIHRSVITIENRTQHLSDFVNTYRTLTDLPTPHKKRVRIDSVINNAVRSLQGLFKRHKIAVRVRINPENLYFNIDPKQIEQVLVNLITNAVYAVREVEQPKIEIYAFSEEKDCIEVKDNGKGIPPQLKREIFVPFFTTRDNGSGIGLSLSKNIIQAHGGFLNCSSEPGDTVFRIRI